MIACTVIMMLKIPLPLSSDQYRYSICVVRYHKSLPYVGWMDGCRIVSTQPHRRTPSTLRRILHRPQTRQTQKRSHPIIQGVVDMCLQFNNSIPPYHRDRFVNTLSDPQPLLRPLLSRVWSPSTPYAHCCWTRSAGAGILILGPRYGDARRHACSYPVLVLSRGDTRTHGRYETSLLSTR